MNNNGYRYRTCKVKYSTLRYSKRKTITTKRDKEYEESSFSSIQKRQEHKQSIYTFSARIRYLLHEQVFCQPQGSVSSSKQLSGPALEAASILRVTT